MCMYESLQIVSLLCIYSIFLQCRYSIYLIMNESHERIEWLVLEIILQNGINYMKESLELAIIQWK